MIFGLEDRRDKPTTLNLQKSSPSKIRTYTTQIQSLVHYQLCYRRINLALVGIAPTTYGLYEVSRHASLSGLDILVFGALIAPS